MASLLIANPHLFEDDIFAFNLQLEEIKVQRELQTGKWREDSAPDFSIAFEDFAAEVRTALQIIEDMKIAQALSSNADIEEPLLERIEIEEKQAQEDHMLAQRLQQGDHEPATLNALEAEGLSQGSIRGLLTWADVRSSMLDKPRLGDDDQTSVAGSVATTIAGPSTPYHVQGRRQTVLEAASDVICNACTDKFPISEIFTVDCSERHTYCRDCLKHIFTSASHDESRFPPKCCGVQIPLADIEKELSKPELEQYLAAVEEYSSGKRIYCANINCGMFIASKNVVNDRARCQTCQTDTCAHCGSLGHEGDCPHDEILQAILEHAVREGWQRCYSCRAMVERRDGCDHMTYAS